MDDEQHHQQIQEIFDEAQKPVSPESRALADFGMNVSPGSEEPEQYAIGNHAHEYAEKFVAGLPAGLDPERTIQDDGKTYRLDRVDWSNATFWEIKPQTTDKTLLTDHAQQIGTYADSMNRLYPECGDWQGKLGLYDPAEVRQDMVDKGLLPPAELIPLASDAATFEAMRDFYPKQNCEQQTDKPDTFDFNRGLIP
jgi:hypothetical protein